MVDPITETDLTAFVDGQIDARRRLEVEAHLARHPDVAARVMADLRDRDALRAAFAPQPSLGPDRLRVAARRLDRALVWRRIGARLRRAAAVALLFGTGWFAHAEVGVFGVPDTFASPVDPSLVEDARQARQTAQIRARMVSQRATPLYDRAEIEAVTGIALPELPSGWMVRDVQVFPARHGSGVEVGIDAGALGEVELFATRSPSSGGRSHEVTRSNDGTTAYWKAGRTAYALSGTRDDRGLHDAAMKFAAGQDTTGR